MHGSGDETASLAHILFHSVFNTLDYANKYHMLNDETLRIPKW